MKSKEVEDVKIGSQDSSSLISIFEDCLGCKWTISILVSISDGFNRPGILLKKNQGLSTKVLNECLRRLVEYKILQKFTYPETPPRVEYFLTSFGQEITDILIRIRQLQNEFQNISQ
ncbi:MULTISPECIES: helix-turn-helix domain-containing protein [unclassified Synechocystis]|uniref:winged helix-turn-helix transcriptional regulator n=1 Tax=unclassified Synechocystis TaxID=2640012 RepID=UPI00041D2E50|nr:MULTISPECIES: helix-turn-helix domain-containing protein [unclassified Synechocystis]AIE73567.1 Transcriptional regulator, HxlR family [Synechocystis sp. PCC 6714]MCT0252282.1 helix-turn-helix transcriptional regulator [Synechocystis sp. CS-94]